MSEIVHTGAGVLFMKVGTHAKEDLADIIARKNQEIADAGFAMWGYGGNTCHPRSMVQPFAEEVVGRGESIVLCMQEMNSRHFADPVRAREYSVDSLTWQKVPDGINVRGSRFALVIKGLRADDFELPLDRVRVPVGPSTGRLGSRYLKGQADKACFEVMDRAEQVNESELRAIRINLVADVIDPYAVFVRN